MKKVLFLGMHRANRSPSQRYRFEQYFEYLRTNGVECELSSLISAEDDKTLYKKGHYFAKLKVFLKSIRIRRNDIKRADNYEFIFIQREAFMTGTTYFERKLSQSKAKLIFDFDDSIWLDDPSSHHGLLGRLKRPSKTSQIITLADTVIAGNKILSDYAVNYNSNVQVIPTTIDTNLYRPATKHQDGKVVIGWTGSFSTIKHFEELIPVLKEIKDKYQDKVTFKVIGDESYYNSELEIKGEAWQADTEVEDLQKIDIGIMPLPDNEWTRGKCGAKGLQYMGLAIPTIMSPVGVNNDIIEDGVNGYLANSKEDWLNKLSKLIEFPEFREKLGAAGRQTVVQHYSVEANKEKYLGVFSN